MFKTEQYNFNPFVRNCNIIKNFFKKPIILTLAILHAVLGTLLLADFVIRHFFLSTYTFHFSYITEIFSICLFFPFSIGYIIVYIKSRENNPMSTPLSGFSLLHVVSILKLVSIFAIYITATMSFREFLNTTAENVDPGIETFLFAFGAVFAIGLIMLIALLLVIAFLFYIFQCRFFYKIKQNLTTISMTYKCAGTYRVFNIIFAVCVFLFGFNILTHSTAEDFAEGGISYIIAIITILLIGVIFTLNAIMASKYKKYMKATIAGYNQIYTEQPSLVHPPHTQPQNSVEAIRQSPSVFTSDDISHTVNPQNCPHCNAPVYEDAVFCNSCGNKIH